MLFGNHISSCVLKLKDVSKVAYDQLTIDIETLKEFFLGLPKIQIPEDSELKITSNYIRFVKKAFTKSEYYIKIISSTSDHVAEMYLEL